MIASLHSLPLDFEKNEKFFHMLVSKFKQYAHAKFCPNRMNRIQMPSQNVICGVKLGRFWTFDRRPSSGILRKIFFRRLVSKVNLYVHAKFSPNQMNRIRVLKKTITLGSFFSCDKAVHRALQWELIKDCTDYRHIKTQVSKRSCYHVSYLLYSNPFWIGFDIVWYLHCWLELSEMRHIVWHTFCRISQTPMPLSLSSWHHLFLLISKRWSQNEVSLSV